MMIIGRKRCPALLKAKFQPSVRSFDHFPCCLLSSMVEDREKKAIVRSVDDRLDTDVRILRELGKHLWPDANHPNSINLKSRVVAAVSLLVASKLINIQVPFLFKNLIDSFEIDHTLLVNNLGDPLLLVTPIAVVLGYGIARASASLAAECRSAIFAPVVHDAIRQGKHSRTKFDIFWNQQSSLSHLLYSDLEVNYEVIYMSQT